MSQNKTKYILTAFWVAFICASLYVYFFNRDLITSQFLSFSGSSLIWAYIIYLVAGCLRGFTLIPITYFIVAGIVLLPPLPLYILTMIGVLVSSASVYYFSEYLNFDEYFEKNHGDYIKKIKDFLSKNELPIVIGWSFMPFLPTDLICYVCGTLDIDIRKFLLGVFIGEGVSCAIYIFLGKEILSRIF